MNLSFNVLKHDNNTISVKVSILTESRHKLHVQTRCFKSSDIPFFMDLTKSWLKLTSVCLKTESVFERKRWTDRLLFANVTHTVLRRFYYTSHPAECVYCITRVVQGHKSVYTKLKFSSFKSLK